MTSLPLNFADISLWLASTAIILILTSEILSSQYSNVNIYINRKRLRNTALGVSVLFLGTIAIRIINIILWG